MGIIERTVWLMRKSRLLKIYKYMLMTAAIQSKKLGEYPVLFVIEKHNRGHAIN